MELIRILLIFNILNEILLKPSLRVDANTSQKEKDLLANITDEEIEKMAKQFGIDQKDLKLLKDDFVDTTKTEKSKNLSINSDPIKSILDSDKKGLTDNKIDVTKIYSNNKEVLKHFVLSQNDINNVISPLLDFKIFKNLPIDAMNIVNKANKNSSFNYLNATNKTKEVNELTSNTLNSIAFIDHENKIGRKGMLTIINLLNTRIQNVWSVLNNKVFSFFRPNNHLKIVKIFRVALIKVKDMLFSPCFFIEYKQDIKSRILVCALNFRDKNYWLKTFNYHKEQYNALLNNE